MHRVVKEVLEKLIFTCPRCKSFKRAYVDIQNHIKGCQGIDAAMDREQVEQIYKIAEKATPAPIDKIPAKYSDLLIYIMEKDSKKFYIYNSKSQAVTLNSVNTPTNFPHNF